MDELILIIKNESDEDFLKRIYCIASSADYIKDESVILNEIKAIIKTRLG